MPVYAHAAWRVIWAVVWFCGQDIATSPRSKLSAVPDMFLQLAISFIRSAIRKRAKFDIRDVRLAALSSWDSAHDASYCGPNK